MKTKTPQTISKSSSTLSIEEQVNQLTTEELVEGWKYLKKLSLESQPFRLVEEEFLHIRTKDGRIVPLRLNKAQKHIYGIIKKLWDEGKPIRLIILKARQVGSTTEFTALIYAAVSQTESQSASIIADEKGKANGILEMCKLFQERCPDYLRPDTKKSNERKLEFDGIHSQISIDTAENKDAGRSSTLRYVLLSEYAFYRKQNAEEIMLGISHSVPTLPRTMIIKETTANGFNHFKEEWDMAVEGQNEYTPIFIPWYWDEGYMMDVPEGFEVGDGAFGEIAKEEKELYKQMESEGIDFIEERLQWRRWDIRNNCKGDVDQFKQENPSTPEEAFIASGQCFFDKRKLSKQLKVAGEPLYRANIVKENFKFVLRKDPEGDFAFYQEPTSYGQYCIGGDACSGSGEDFASLCALNKSDNETVATLYAKIDHDELAYKAYLLASFLNQCKVAIENDKFGFAANEALKKIYGNLYVQRTHNRIDNKIVEKFGWDTNSVTRPKMLGQLQSEIKEESTKLRDKKLIKECLTFIKNPDSGRPEAENGEHDDFVMARAIAGMLRLEEPYLVKSDRPRGADAIKAKSNAGMRFSKKG